jgi:hypothetical protein
MTPMDRATLMMINCYLIGITTGLLLAIAAHC